MFHNLSFYLIGNITHGHGNLNKILNSTIEFKYRLSIIFYISHLFYF